MTNLNIIGIAFSDAHTIALYTEGRLLPQSADVTALVDAALQDAGMAATASTRLILIGNSAAPNGWAGSVETVPTASAAIRAAQDTQAPVVIADVNTGAVVLSLTAANRIYAMIENIGDTPAAALAQRPAQHISYLELGNPDDANERNALLAAYGTQSPDLTCALGQRGGLAALMTAALAVYHHFIPGAPDWETPNSADAWNGSPFYAMETSKSWFLDEERGQDLHRAAVNWPEIHLILADTPNTAPRLNTFINDASLRMYIVTAPSESALPEQLRQLDETVRRGDDLEHLAVGLAEAYSRNPNGSVVALIGRDRDDLLKEIDAALKGAGKGQEWFTPRGSYYTPRPSGRSGKVAFVYPGAFNSYPRMMQDMLFMFPQVHYQLNQRIDQIGRALGDPYVHPRSFAKLTKRDWRTLRKQLEARTSVMIEAGIASSVVFTEVLRTVFNIQPEIAFGYSVGETSMLYALDIWRDDDDAHDTLHNSPIYSQRLAGPKNAAREMWGLPADAPDDFWGVFFIAASASVVAPAVAKEPRAFLTHINTPDEVVIAGDAEACQRVIDSLGVNGMRASFDMIIHADPTFSEYGLFYELHDHAVNPAPKGLTFYSGADYAPVAMSQSALAHSVTRMVCKPVDFPRLVDRVYDDGARIFIELGPRSTCARWISESLGARDHLAVSINHLGTDDYTALLKMLARLVGHGLPMNLNTLYVRPERATTPVTQVAASGNYAANAVSVPGMPEGVMPYSAVTQAHKTFLASRLDGLRMLGDLMALQAGSPAAMTVTPTSPAIPTTPNAPVTPRLQFTPQAQYTRSEAVFDEYKLEQFAIGSIPAAFGPEYEIYADRRAPRIPNGDLLLVSRVIDIDGVRRKPGAGAYAVSEYDVPVEPWFYRDNAYPSIPYSVYMEMALQLCGFLSAYLGSTLDFPEMDFYFRNLDGEGTLHSDLDLRGKTITNRVSMTSSITLQGIILQKFTFALELEGQVFYEGTASFGFFTLEAMRNQTGLDKGKPTQPWYIVENIPMQPVPNPDKFYQAPPGKPHYRLASGQLDLLDAFLMKRDSGKYGKGYVYAVNNVQPEDWFFYCHFHEDPVMPGSLGVEAILQSMQAYALETGIGAAFQNPHFEQAADINIVWHYRGQVTRAHDKILMEVHFKRIEHTSDGVMLVGDASLWRPDGLRIYEVIDIALLVKETGA